MSSMQRSRDAFMARCYLYVSASGPDESDAGSGGGCGAGFWLRAKSEKNHQPVVNCARDCEDTVSVDKQEKETKTKQKQCKTRE
jgi:hypothetical protein